MAQLQSRRDAPEQEQLIAIFAREQAEAQRTGRPHAVQPTGAIQREQRLEQLFGAQRGRDRDLRLDRHPAAIAKAVRRVGLDRRRVAGPKDARVASDADFEVPGAELEALVLSQMHMQRRERTRLQDGDGAQRVVTLVLQKRQPLPQARSVDLHIHTNSYDNDVVKPQRRSQPERRAATRQAILQAAARLFAERGYQAVSLDEIAAAAGYTRGAVHYNFSGKHELLQTLLEDNLAARGAAVAAADPSSVATTLPYDRQTSLLFLEFAAAAARDPQIGRALLAGLDAGRERNRGAIEALLDRAGAPAEQADELAAIVGAFVNGLSIEALAGADIQMLEARFSRLVEILLDDLRHGGQAER